MRLPGELKGQEERGWVEIVEKVYREVMAQKEEIIKAFIAKYGCEPDEIEQVQENGLNRICWYIRRRKPEGARQ